VTDTIVLIHGLWMTPRSWEHWIDRFERRGYRVLAPSWPGMEAEVEALRRDPAPIARLDVRRIVGHYETIIRELDQPPVVMGHSFGGAFTLLLLDRGLGAAGVAIAPAAVRGIRDVPLTTLRSIFPVLRNPLNVRRAVPLSRSRFHYAFTNTLTPQQSQAIYERYHVPAAGRVLFQGALANLLPRTPLRVDFGREDRAPLLVLGGGADHIVPARVAAKIARAYAASPSPTHYEQYAGRSHHTLGQDGWEAVADYALAWAVEHARLRHATTAVEVG
jgi:alpha-beta hydrolase superfamily lysophospholipase